MAWNAVKEAKMINNPPVEKHAPGASLFVPLTIAAGASSSVKLMMAWYVPLSNLKIGENNPEAKAACSTEDGCCKGPADLGITGLASVGRFDLQALVQPSLQKYWRGR